MNIFFGAHYSGKAFCKAVNYVVGNASQLENSRIFQSNLQQIDGILLRIWIFVGSKAAFLLFVWYMYSHRLKPYPQKFTQIYLSVPASRLHFRVCNCLW